MKVIFLKKGNVHGIYPTKPHPKSYAAALILAQHYQRLEDEAYASMKFDPAVPVPDSYAKNWKVRLAFNTQFLTETKERDGCLTCVYCGKSNLVIDALSQENLATADHFVPVSKGGHPFDMNNLVVACYKCNNRKGSGTGIISEDGKYSFVREPKRLRG